MRKSVVLLILLSCLLCSVAPAQEGHDLHQAHDPKLSHGVVADMNQPGLIYLKSRDLQETIDEAMPHSIIMCDPNRAMMVKRAITVHKPLTIVGLHAFLEKGLCDAPIVVISADHVAMKDFWLRGNVGSVPFEHRASLIAVRANHFIIENGIVTDSARHGVIVSARQAEANLHTGIIRNITGRNIARDVISLEGHGDAGYFVRHVIVEDIKGYESHDRGAVETCDGTEFITIRGVYAEDCVYGVDVQEHGEKGQVNKNISIVGVRVKNCTSAVRASHGDQGHCNLMMVDISSSGWREDEDGRLIVLRNTSNITLANVEISENEKSPAIHAKNCDGLILRNVLITKCNHKGAAIVIEDCGNVVVDGLILRNDAQNLTNAILCQIVSNRDYANLGIHNVIASNTTSAGIVLRNRSMRGKLDSYVISGNTAKVWDHINAENSKIINNLMGPSGNGLKTESAETQEVIGKSVHQAAYEGDLSQIQMHIAAGTDLNAIDEHDYGQTALHIALRKGHIDIAKTLITVGADVGVKTAKGMRPLHLAAEGGHAKVIELLISKGADFNARNSKGQTPLHLTIRSENIEAAKESIDLLLSKGADLDAKDSSGSTVLDEAALGFTPRKVFEFLLSKGAKISSIHLAAYRGDVERVRSFMKEGVDVDAKKTENQLTPLDYAVRGRRFKTAKFLVAEGANPNGSAKDMPALPYAIMHGNNKIAECLLSNGADPNSQGRQSGMPVLHIAVLVGNKEMVDLLIKNGADVKARDKREKTALDYAKQFRKQEIIDLLKKHGAKE